MTNPGRNLIVAISGASGVVYGMEMLKVLKDLGVNTHVVVSRAARQNLSIETSYTMDDVRDVSTRVYGESDLAAPIASGSFFTMGMVVIPCSIKTLSGIANCFATNLLIRAADVTLKEKRPLVLVVRETPLHEGHLKLMLAAASMGAVILPPVPAFYHNPETIEDLIRQTVGKVLDSLHISHTLFKRWGADE